MQATAPQSNASRDRVPAQARRTPSSHATARPTPQHWRLATFALMLLSVLALALATGGGAHAHHGWGWATDDKHELTGTIVAVRLGNPHGEITLDVDGEQWVVEVGQPWRNEQVGLVDALLTVGTTLTALGPRSARAGERLLKAERVTIDGTHYDLYPERLR